MPKTSPQDIWAQYQKIVSYLNTKDLYNEVKENEKFWEGKHWEGLPENSKLPKPVFNVLQRAGKYMVATIGSNDVAISMTPFTESPQDVENMVPISKAVEDAIEIAKIKEKSKVIIRNAFVDGAGYLLTQFNPNFDTGQPMKGIIDAQVVDNTNMYFGNPYSRDIQTQPWIIVALRQHISQVKREAKEHGLTKDLIDQIKPDMDANQANDDSQELVTVLIKFYRDTKEVIKYREEFNIEKGAIEIIEEKFEEESVWFTKCTSDVTLIKPTDLGYKRYPVSCFGWDLVKNSYLYTSPMTAVRPNQIFINKTYALAQMFGTQSCMPKILYDKSKVDLEDFMNTSASAVAGMDMAGKFLDFIKVPDFSDKIIDLAQETIAQTKECLGVTDASLGNVRPDNTSAIVALQESSSVPLEIQKAQFYEFWEDTVRNLLDIMAGSYGVRQVMTDDKGLAEVDFSVLKNLNYNLKVEIGNGAQFSEIAQINTLDKLVQAGFIPPDAYMKAIPSKYLPQKASLIDAYYRQQQAGLQPQPVGSTPANETIAL